jgi:hypothetical protein
VGDARKGLRRLRRWLPAELRTVHDAFEDVLEILEPAKARLTQVVPTTRIPGRPLDEAAREFGEALDRASARMPSWRHADVEDVWRACDDGIRAARARVGSLTADPDGFEGLIWIVEQLLDPLEPFAEAARRFADLRVRGG